MDYSEKFLKVMRFVLKWEGGYVDNPSDPGGETKYGISKRSYPNEDIANLTIERALQIYHESYWRAIDGESRPFPEALAVMDFAVNSGVSRSLRFWSDSGKDVDAFVAARVAFLTSISTFNVFGRGWIRRVEDLRNVVREEDASPDVEFVQLFYRGSEFTFRPERVTIGTSNSGRVKIMARLP